MTIIQSATVIELLSLCEKFQKHDKAYGKMCVYVGFLYSIVQPYTYIYIQIYKQMQKPFKFGHEAVDHPCFHVERI